MKIPRIDAMVDDIKNDRVSGSSILAHRAAECLDEFATEIVQNQNMVSPKVYFDELIDLGKRLITAQATMAAVFNGVNEIITSVKNELKILGEFSNNSKNEHLHALCLRTQLESRKFKIRLKLAHESIASLYSEVLKQNDRIMTISASGSVEILLTTAFDNSMDISVYLPESRPMYEGRILAQRLAQKGLDCTLIADHAMFHFLKDCTKVIVGADRVTPKGLLNKIGTYGLALAAQEEKIPFICTCDCFKFVPDIISIDRLNPPQPESQLYYLTEGENKPETLKINNVFFDFTPLKYIGKFITDCGSMDNKQIREHIDQVMILPELIENRGS